MHASTPASGPHTDSGTGVTDRHGDVGTDGNIVDGLHRRLPAAERARLRDRIARTRLGLPAAPAAPKRRPRPVPPRPPAWPPTRPKIVSAPIRTRVPAQPISLADLDPGVRVRAERLLAAIPEGSLDREAQACRVALTLTRAAS